MGLLRDRIVLVSGGTQGVNGVDIGWTDTDGEDEIQRRFHGATDWDQNVPGAHD